jgi:hypothetical protein
VVIVRTLAVAVILGAASVASAQTTAEPPIAIDNQLQIQRYERVLVAAVEEAATRVGKHAREFVPDFQMQFDTAPLAKGYALPTGTGIFFTLEVPGIEPTNEAVFRSMLRNQQQGAPLNQNLPRVGNNGPTGAPVSMMDPAQEYSDFTRQAVIDTMLDQAFALPVKEGQSFTVSVAAAPTPGPAGRLEAPGRRLYLTLKADDLMALRANRITRDEAKGRIIEQRY